MTSFLNRFTTIIASSGLFRLIKEYQIFVLFFNELRIIDDVKIN